MSKAGRLIGWTRSFGRSEADPAAQSPGASTSPRAPTLLMAQDELTAWFDEHGSCPDCGGKEFLEGPRGGLSQNMKCSNRVCSAEFNLTFFQGRLFFADRIKWDHPPGSKAH